MTVAFIMVYRPKLTAFNNGAENGRNSHVPPIFIVKRLTPEDETAPQTEQYSPAQ
jgi:hypothetical protein